MSAAPAKGCNGSGQPLLHPPMDSGICHFALETRMLDA
jgi:hypothetical protein